MLFRIHKLKQNVHIGLDDQEKSHEQEILISMIITVDFKEEIVIEDSIEYTMDYRFFVKIIEEVLRGKTYSLLESIAVTIIKSFFQKISGVKHISITIEKTMTHSFRFADSISITLDSDELSKYLLQ